MGMKGSILSVMALSVLATAFMQDEMLVRRSLMEGDKDTYQVTTKVVQTMTPTDPKAGAMVGGETRFEMSMSLELKSSIGKLSEDKKSAAFDLDFSNIVYDFGSMSGMVPQDSLPKAMKANGRIDERGRVLEMRMPDLPSALGGSGGMAGPMMVELPEKAIKIGDSWQVAIPTADALGAKGSTMTAKLIGIEEYESIPSLLVELTASMPIDADLGESVQASGAPPMKMLAKGKFDMKGRAFVQRSNGKTLRMDLNFDTTTRVNLPDIGIEFDTTGHGNSTIRIVKPK
jgi:hypothetical protein